MVPNVRYLLDTHVWLWAVLGDRRLSRAARRVLGSLTSAERVGLAAISLKEAAWLLARGRVVAAGRSWQDWLRQASRAPNIELMPLTIEVAIASEDFSSSFPTDPADRLIAAPARVNGFTLMTADDSLRDSREVATLW